MSAELATDADIEAAGRDGYFISKLYGEWLWGINGVVWADGYVTAMAAWRAAIEHWRPKQPELCDRCGDQAVCPDCVGT